VTEKYPTDVSVFGTVMLFLAPGILQKFSWELCEENNDINWY
jgi:hypothetical protein